MTTNRASCWHTFEGATEILEKENVNFTIHLN